MLQKELATALNISPAMVSKLAKRGMPTDTPERAQRWRKRHLEPGRVKAALAPTGQGAAPRPTLAQPTIHADAPASKTTSRTTINWLARAAPDRVSVHTVETVAAACANLLESVQRPDDAAYPLAFLRDLLRRLTPEDRPRLPLCVWLYLVDMTLHPEAEVRQSPDGGALLDVAEFAERVNPSRPFAPDWEDAACDWDGLSVTGWPAELCTEAD